MEENTKILIKNGRAVDPVTNTDQQMDILIEGPMIVKTGQLIEDDEAQIIDAAGLTVAPGLMDSHVHFRDPGFTYKEDIFTGAQAAAAGGVTGVVCMANTKPPVDSLETLDYVQKKKRRGAGQRVPGSDADERYEGTGADRYGGAVAGGCRLLHG